LFFNLFEGRRDIFPIHWKSSKTQKSGYTPVCINEWKRGICLKLQKGKCKDCSFRKYKSFTEKETEEHLLGKIIAGVYPMLEDNTTHFLAIDFDKKGWEEESRKFLAICAEYKIPACLERSRSGNGGHVWIFYTEKYPAVKSRIIAFYLLQEAGIVSAYSKEQSFDRIFSNQDTLSLQGFGNLIALPLQAEARKGGNSEFIDPETLLPFFDQWELLQNIKKVNPKFLDSLVKKFEKNDSIIEDSKTSKLQIFQINNIQLRKSQLNGKLIKFIKEELNIPNPEYFSKKRLGKSVYKTPQYFCAIKENAKTIFLPRGFVRKLTEFCIKNDIPYILENSRVKFKKVKFNSKISLYPYQEPVFELAQKYPEGVILAPPGTGKTIIGLQIIAEKKLPALILVHRKQILEQWLERIESFLGIHKRKIGQIHGAKKKIGDKITVAMLQSLNSVDEKKLLKIGTVIVDECHHIPAKTFNETIQTLCPKYLYGLTATAKRKHNDEKLIFAYIGDIIAEVEFDEQTSKRNANIQIIDTAFSLPFVVNSDNLQQALKIMIFDTQRNQLIKEKILENLDAGKILIITERKEHVDVLNLYLREKVETITFTGDLSKKKREVKIKQIESENFQVLIATGQVFGEGIDIHNLDTLFLVFPFSFEGKLIQYIGRIQRSENKKQVFDFRDLNIEYFERMFKQRNKHYKKLTERQQGKLFI